MRHRITIDRWAGIDEIPRETWKDLISALVLSGFEIYGDESKISFITGDGEIVEEIEG